jgi:resuscitation-promoting factor RpfA
MPAPATEPTSAAEPESATALLDRFDLNLIDMDRAMPIAGGAGLGLLLLGGAAAVRRRRRRKQERADYDARWAVIDASAAAGQPEAQEPTFAAAAEPRHDPVPSAAPDGNSDALPEGFDLSRFGPHVQAAYRGPTPDNPSLSLRHRLRRASGLDQQERRTEQVAGSTNSPEGPATIPAKGKWESRPDADFLFRRAEGKPASKPVLQD